MAFVTPNVFVPNTLVQSTPVNANFTAIENYINTTLETSAAHASDIALLPKGKVGYVQVVANQAGITTIVDLTSLTLTFTAVASRYYKITGAVASFSSTVADDTAALYITDGAGTQIQAMTDIMRPASLGVSIIAMAVIQPGAGSKTYKLRAARVAGTGSLTMGAAATQPAFLLIEDIGL